MFNQNHSDNLFHQQTKMFGFSYRLQKKINYVASIHLTDQKEITKKMLYLPSRVFDCACSIDAHNAFDLLNNLHFLCGVEE